MSLSAIEHLLKHAIESPPQTNEVGRSAVLLGGFLRIAGSRRCETGITFSFTTDF